MYWSRRWKVHNCKPCNYIGIAKNAKSVCITSGNCTTKKHGREGVLHTVILPDDRLYANVHCPKERTNKYLIKSGLQPNKNEPKYSYSYNDYLKNKRRMTYDMKLPTSKGNGDLYGYGGKCDSNVINSCNMAKTTAKFSNKKFYKQGAVDSSSRIDRLRYNTIVGAVKCKNDPNKCVGVYPNAAGRRESYKELYNENHPENCCPQHVARRKALGVYNSIYKLN
jgi:hypothetical protein